MQEQKTSKKLIVMQGKTGLEVPGGLEKSKKPGESLLSYLEGTWNS